MNMTPKEINRKLGKIYNLLLDAKDVKTPSQQNFFRLAKADLANLRQDLFDLRSKRSSTNLY